MHLPQDFDSTELALLLVARLDSASPGELAAAVNALGDMHTNFSLPASKRKIAGYLRTAVRRIK